MDYASVLIPTLNRYTHLKRCIESLARCTGAEHADLFVALDFPSKPEHFEGCEKICEHLKCIHGFRKVIIIKRSANFGQFENYRSARAEIRKNHDEYI